MPSSGLLSPRPRAASAARAASRPRSKSRTQIALILLSWRSMRPITCCASSTAETFLAASAADNSMALPKLHCDFAKTFLPDFFVGTDDAQFERGPQASRTDSPSLDSREQWTLCNLDA